MRRPLIAIVSVLLAVMAFAQAPQQHRLDVGGHAGVTLSKINFNPTVPQSMQTGMTAGVMLRYIAEKNFGLVAELNVAQRGWKESFEESDYSYNRRFTYLELPILTHIYFGGQRVKGFFNLGPELNVMLGEGTSSNFDYHNAGDLEYFNNEARHTEQMSLGVSNKLDYGISVGAGMELSLNAKQSLLLEGRFYYGLTDVFPNHKTDIFSGSSSMTVAVTLGYLFNLSR